MIIKLEEATDVNKYGGKATNLARLIKNNIKVPFGWVISHDSFERNGSLLDSEVLELKDNIRYAVRSSATIEDAADKSWAGQFDTYLNVNSSDVISKVEECHTASNERSKAYAAEVANTDVFKVAVIVQEMIDPEYAGVLFTKDPVGGSDDVIVEYIEGLGEELVSGKKTPNHASWNRMSKRVSNPTMSFEISRLIKQSLDIEKIYDSPQDIEWALDKNGIFWFLQTRPITTLKGVGIKTQKSSEELSKFYEKQIAFTEWLERINHDDIKKIRTEVANKRNRLATVGEIILFPSDTPTKFEAADLTNRTEKLKKFLEERGEELCALRLVPKPGVHKEILRNRGKKIKDVMKWYDSQEIDPALYTIEFVPHMETNKWATIIIVNDKGIFGEIINDGHYVLTQGFDGVGTRHTFTYDFKKWNIVPKNDEALEHLKYVVNFLKVEDISKQKLLKERVDTEYSYFYMKGYFETVCSDEDEIWFIDYDRILVEQYKDYFPNLTVQSKGELKGKVASNPQKSVTGTARIVTDPNQDDIGPDDILVCEMTSPDFIPLMLKSKAVITNQGGILCHAAIVARELKKPCIVGTIKATKYLNDGDNIELDLETGTIKKI